MAKENRIYGGIGFPGLLTINFIVLKLTGVIAWSWWWVLAPMWVGVVGALLLALVFMVVAVVKAMRK